MRQAEVYSPVIQHVLGSGEVKEVRVSNFAYPLEKAEAVFRDLLARDPRVKLKPVKAIGHGDAARPEQERLVKKCPRCHNEYRGTHVQKHCDPCRLVLSKVRTAKADHGRKR